MHYADGNWNMVSPPWLGTDLFSISMTSDSEGWAVGGVYYHGAMPMPSFVSMNDGTFSGINEWDYRNENRKRHPHPLPKYRRTLL
jgi:hypothetical protein